MTKFSFLDREEFANYKMEDWENMILYIRDIIDKKKIKYIVVKENKETGLNDVFECCTQEEVGKIIGRSISGVNRIVNGKTKEKIPGYAVYCKSRAGSKVYDPLVPQLVLTPALPLDPQPVRNPS